MNGVTRLIGKVGRTMMKCKPVAKVMVAASRNKPEILAVTGGVAVVTAFVLAIRGGTKVKAVMAKGAEKVEAVEARKMQELSVEDLTEEQKTDILKACGKDLKMARADGVWQVAKLFLLPSGLLVIGLVLIGGGHHILKKRNVVLAGLAEGYKTLLTNYRKNVVQAEGEEADQNYLRGVIGEKDVEHVVVDNDGNETKVKKRVPVVRDGKNPWRFEFSDDWFWSYEDDSERNLFFLKCEQEWWNHEYKRNGEVCMYEVLKHLRYKFDKAKEGMTPTQYRKWMTFLRNYGWRKGCGGDDFIDFGLYRAINEAAVKRQSDVIFIEFNCDGNLENLTELNNSKWR